MSVEFKGDGYRAWIPHELPVDNDEDGNLDIHVYLADGKHFVGTCYTPRNLEILMDRFRDTGERAAGLYIYDPSMLVVRDLSQESLRAIVEEIIRSGDLEKAFERAD